MKKELEKPIIAVVSLFSLIVVIFAALQASGVFFPEQARSTIVADRLAILKAYSTNNQTLFAEVRSLSTNATLTQAIIRDSTGNTTVTSILSDKILYGETKTVKVNLNVALASGTYNITLRTRDGGNFVSPAFTVP